MKMLKKLAALVLAATMVLVLFTACGGDTPQSPEAQAENQVMSAINATRPEGQKLENNAQRRAVASQSIDLAAKGGLKNYFADIYFNMETAEIKDGKFAVTFVSKYDYKDTKLDALLQKIAAGGSLGNADIKQSTKWSEVGVVVRTVEGQTYIAISVAVDAHPNR